VIVFAASSLRTALDRIKSDYEAAHSDVLLSISTGTSPSLRAQIELNDRADIFLSADAFTTQKLVDAGKADGPPEAFAQRPLAIVTPVGNPAGVTSPVDLARPGIRIVAAADEVPITGYANQAIAYLAGQPGYPVGFAGSYAANIVATEDSDDAVTARIAAGDGDVAILYATDAIAAQLPTIPLPDEAVFPSTYQALVLRGAQQGPAAHQLLDWIKGPNGQSILTGLGFSSYR